MFKPKCPCVQDCPDRSIYCRNDCEKYKDYYEQYMKYREELEKKQKQEIDYNDYKSNVYKKPMKNIYRNIIQGRTGGR